MKRTDITTIFPEATKEQIDQLLDLNGADIAKARGEADKAKGDLDTYRADLETAQKRIQELEKAETDLQAAKDRAAALETELNGLKDANRIRDIRAAVAKETGVPMELLTADSEDACKAQAKGIQDYAKSGNYPEVKDGGETPTPAPAGTTGAWQNLISQINSNSN